MNMENTRLTTFITLLMSLTLLSGCSGGDDGSNTSSPEPTGFVYSQPETDVDWSTSHTEDLGLDTDLLENMINRQDLEAQNIHSILIVKDGELVFETYNSGENSAGQYVDFDKDTPHEMFSVTKSIASLLVGIALDEDLIDSIDDPVSTYLPDYASHFVDNEKSSMDLYDSLTMQSGIEWNELTSNSFSMMVSSNDPLEYLLSLPSISAPGNVFEYNTGVSFLMAEILEYTTGQSISDYANDTLFDSLNITNVSWQQHASGLIYSGTGLRMLPRDMAKVGQLILDGGTWNNERIVSESWTLDSTLPQVNLTGYTADGYGYYWWLRDFDVAGETVSAVYAAGFGGQYIFVLPDYEMVVVFTSGNFGGNASLPHTLMEEDVLPSLLN